ncbi:hypothetical protein DFS34DRAFT_630313 [Phlyctochytrium arcticum]|nr:hypothetical protein DFS34DRAFT_630313 [Phlyctochytrium arcticum]
MESWASISEQFFSEGDPCRSEFADPHLWLQHLYQHQTCFAESSLTRWWDRWVAKIEEQVENLRETIVERDSWLQVADRCKKVIYGKEALEIFTVAYQNVSRQQKLSHATEDLSTEGLQLLSTPGLLKNALTRGINEVYGNAPSTPKPSKRAKKVKVMPTSVVRTPNKSQVVANNKFSLNAELEIVTKATLSDRTPDINTDTMHAIIGKNFVPASVGQLLIDLADEDVESTAAIFFPDPANSNDKNVHFAKAVLFDFWSAIRFNPLPQCAERKYLVTRFGPLLNHFEQTFGTVRFEWIEKQSQSTKDLQRQASGTKLSRPSTFNVDMIGYARFDESEIIFVESSGGTGARNAKDFAHATEDGTKIIHEAIDGAKYRLAQYLDSPAENAKELKSFALHVIGDRMTLIAVTLVGANHFLAMECKSARLPASWHHVHEYHEVLDLLFYLKAETEEQAKVGRSLQRLKRVASEENRDRPSVRDWVNHKEE